MTDTPDYIYKIQYNIIAAKSMNERVQLGLDTIDDTRKWIVNSIKMQNPTINAADLAVEIFLRYYKNDFTTEQLEKITSSMLAYHKSKILA